MEIKDLIKATQLLKDINELNEVIAILDKKAMAIVNGDRFKNIALTFQSDKPTLPQEEVSPQSIMELYMERYSIRPKAPKTPVGDSLGFVLDDTECLFVIGALMSVFKDKRQAFVSTLNNLGVKV